MAVGHEPEGSKGLPFGDFSDVVPELFVRLACIAGASLGFDDGEHVAAGVVQAVVGNTVPGLRVIATNWNLQSDLGTVVEFPVSRPQLRVDVQDTSSGFVLSHGGKPHLLRFFPLKGWKVFLILYNLLIVRVTGEKRLTALDRHNSGSDWVVSASRPLRSGDFARGFSW